MLTLPLSALPLSTCAFHRVKINAGRLSRTDVTPSLTADMSFTGIMAAVWIGTTGALKISKVTQFDPKNLYMLNTVTLLNTGTTQMTQVHYMVYIDANQEEV